jgi:hypothetical protein
MQTGKYPWLSGVPPWWEMGINPYRHSNVFLISTLVVLPTLAGVVAMVGTLTDLPTLAVVVAMVGTLTGSPTLAVLPTLAGLPVILIGLSWRNIAHGRICRGAIGT